MSGLTQALETRQRLPRPQIAKAIRQAADVSQNQVADELGVHRVTVARWESGERKPAGDLASRYADVLDLLRKAAS